MKYISHRAVLTILPQTLLELPDSLLDNYIIQCIRQIDASPMYSNKLYLTKVTNGVAELPEDFIKAFGVYYNYKEPTEDEYNSLLGCLDDNCHNDDLNDGTERCISDAPLLEESCSNINVDYSNYMQTSFMNNCWKPLYTSDRLFTYCYLDKKSPCTTSQCDYRFSFDKCGHILTSMPNGWLKIAYVGRPTTPEGDYLIPDDMEYMKVLKDGVIMLYYEERRLDQREGAINNHREYEEKFYKGIAALRGSSLLPKGMIKDKQLRNIIYDKIKIANDYSLTGNGGWTGHTLYKNMRI